MSTYNGAARIYLSKLSEALGARYTIGIKNDIVKIFNSLIIVV